MRKYLILLIFISTTSISYSQTPGDIVTDRPDQTESTDIVPPGYTQIETGIMYDRFDETYSFSNITNNTYTFSGLLRIGIFPSMELRIAPEYISSKTTVRFTYLANDLSADASGFTALVVGTKLKITDETIDVPGIAFLFNVDIPSTAGDDFKTEHPTPEFRISAAKKISDRFSLGFNIGGLFYTEETVGLYTLSLGADIAEKLGGFIELYGYFGNGSVHLMDGGLSYRVLKNLQFDISGGIGLSENTPDFSLGAGLSVRLPR